jgi:hypothetical protein
MRVKKKYQNTLAKYLTWVKDDFLRPKFQFDENGISAAEAMLEWETYGKALPSHTSEPDLLALYVQGKTSRDFYIENWREDCRSGQAWPEEFLYTLGFNEHEFRSVFGREPNPVTLLDFHMVDELLRLTEGSTDPYLGFLRSAALRIKERMTYETQVCST